MSDFEMNENESVIREFSVSPKPQNNTAKITLLVLAAISVSLFVTYFLIPNYKGVVGLFAIIFLTIAISVYTRYVSVSYIYDVIIAEDGVPLFVVRQRVGKREQTLCRVELSYIQKIEFETKAERKAKKTAQGFSSYVFFPTVGPEYSCRMTYRSRYEKSEILVELPKEYCELLSQYVEYAKANFVDDEE